MAKPLIITPENSELIDTGKCGVVYLIGDDAIKVPIKICDRFLREEYDIHQAIYGGGYPVPEPRGVIEVLVNGTASAVKAFRMERIYGTNLEEMWTNIGNLFADAEEIKDSIANNLGIGIRGIYQLALRNVMWNERIQGINLIDFGNWWRFR